MKNQSTAIRSLLLGAAFLLPLSAARSTTYNWNLTSANSPVNWTTSSNWSPSTGNPGDDGVNDKVYLNRLASSNSTYNLLLDADRTVGLLGVNYQTPVASSAATFTLTGSHTLTVGSASTPGQISIGFNPTTTATSGTLQIGDSVAISLIGGDFQIASPAAHSASGSVVLQSATAALNVGTTGNRSNWSIAGKNSNNDYAVTGSVSATTAGGKLNAHLAGLSIGTYANTVNNFVKTATSTGSLDLTNFTSAKIDTNTLSVATSANGSTYGTFSIGSHQLTVNNAVTIGTGGNTSGDATTSQNENIVIGTVTMAAESTVAFGSTDTAATLILGTNTGSRVTAGGKVERTGSFTATGGSFLAHLASLTLGVQDATVAGKYYKAEGILDLRAASVSQFEVAGNVMIGNGLGEGSVGRLYLPEVDAKIGGNLLIGDDNVGGGSQVSSLGLLDLAGTRLTIEGDVSVNLTGGINVTLEGSSAGLWLSDEDAVFTLTSISSYSIDFQNASLGQYGFAWRGDHLESLNALINGGYVDWSGSSQIAVYYDSGVTYIGVIPEPGSALLFLLGSAFLVAKIRQKRTA